MTQLEFNERTVVVTGGSQGIGAAVATAFARAGANTVVHYRSREDAAQTVVSEISAAGGRAIALPGRLDRAEDVEELFSTAEKSLGPVAVLINNAGSFPNAPLIDLSLEQWRQMYADNVDSAFLCSKVVAQSMQRTGGGVIINIASIAATIPGPDHAHYNSAKAAVVMLTSLCCTGIGSVQYSRQCRVTWCCLRAGNHEELAGRC